VLNRRWTESAYTLYHGRGMRAVATERGASTSTGVRAARHGGTAWP
jgi:hypothetical protein